MYSLSAFTDSASDELKVSLLQCVAIVLEAMNKKREHHSKPKPANKTLYYKRSEAMARLNVRFTIAHLGMCVTFAKSGVDGQYLFNTITKGGLVSA